MSRESKTRHTVVLEFTVDADTQRQAESKVLATVTGALELARIRWRIVRERSDG